MQTKHIRQDHTLYAGSCTGIFWRLECDRIFILMTEIAIGAEARRATTKRALNATNHTPAKERDP